MLRKIIDERIGKILSFKDFFKQSLLATLFFLLFLFGWNAVIPLENQVLFSAIASSTFLTFVSANIYESLSTKIVGGQATGVAIGVLIWFGKYHLINFLPNYANEILIFSLSLSVGMALFLMSVFDFEHPPAAGTAMAFVFNPNQPVIADALFVIICAILLAIVHYLLKKRHLLKDLI